MTSPKTIWLKVWGALIVVFALGCITGIAVNSLNSRSGQASSMRDTEAYFERLKHDLVLNSEQAATIQTILEETRGEYKSVCAEVRPKYDALRTRARDRMRVLLTADQQRRFDSIVVQEDCSGCPDRKK